MNKMIEEAISLSIIYEKFCETIFCTPLAFSAPYFAFLSGRIV